ncbi:LysR family transcriptional regulator [Bacillus solimangrovi]|uniref:HTH lysR-type domain-containing protein n=1 Tax=Bacillus solimangrovi TaxID=1305675 RepID=A0A1E5LFE8_9BACI|nr:LysR family transcriptional regulator [Bacillus solimangrovi]OEH92790.1 hypothetical protein BFG57_01990 [Bacillus solimangrovi]
MNLQQLRYFVELVNWNSLSKAAEALYISQPALSKQIKNLEQFLGLTLLNRTSKGIELTDDGERLFHKIKPILIELDSIVQEMSSRRKLRVGALISIGSYFFSSRANKENSYQYSIVFRSTTTELLHLLLNKELDAVIVQDVEQFLHLKSKLIFQEEYLVALSETNQLVEQKEVELLDLIEEKIFIPSSSCESSDLVQKIFKSCDINPKIYKEVQTDSLLNYVGEGQGIAFFPSIQAQKNTKKNIVFKKIKKKPLVRSFYLLTHSNKDTELMGQELTNLLNL